MEKKKGLLSFMKRIIHKDSDGIEKLGDESILDEQENTVTNIVDKSENIPQNTYYAMLLINSYLQFLYVFERVMEHADSSEVISQPISSSIEELASIVKEFEETLVLKEAQIESLKESVDLIEEGLVPYFVYKEATESIDGKVKALAPMAYGEKHQIDGLVRSGELFNPESCDRYLQSVPKLTERINLVNNAIHKLQTKEDLEDTVVEEINQWFKHAANFKNVVDSDLSTVKEVLSEVTG